MSLDEDELRRLAAWWRHCKGDESFRQALHFCANQLELALDGELPPLNATLSQGGKRPKWIDGNQP